MLLTLERPEPAPPDPGRPHAVVIGAGFGGLAAAIRLGAKGYRVTVLERLESAGGRARVLRRDGFTFDLGPTLITAPFLFEDLWGLCGRRMSDDVTLGACDPFYKLLFDDGETFTRVADHAAMRAEVARLSPSDLDGYDRFMQRSEAIYRLGFEALGHVPFDSPLDMVKLGPALLRLGGHRSVYAMVSSFVRDPRLRMALSFHPLFVGGSPFDTSAIYCLIQFLEQRWGVHYAVGGTGALVQGLVGLIEGQGGRLRYGAEVQEILVEGGAAVGVRLADGETVPAAVVVSNADAAYTLGRLLPDRSRKSWTRRRLDNARYSMSLLVWYFGTRRRYPEVDHHTIVFGPRYRGLIDDIFKHKSLAPDMSLYLHRPTASDPSLAPPGCEAFYVLSPVPNLDSGVDWAREAEPYRRAIEARLAGTVLPGLGEDIVTSHVVTPAYFHDDLLSPKGAAFSLEPVLTQSAWFRPSNRSPDVDGLYLVGAGTHPGAGLPGVLSSARVLDTVVPDARAVAGVRHAG
jgi:phytoene desaturase